MDALAKIAKLEKKILEMSARSKFQEMGGDVSHWDAGLKNSILPSLSLNDEGDLDQSAFDAVVKQFPGFERHLNSYQEQPTPAMPSVGGTWEAVNQARAAASPRR